MEHNLLLMKHFSISELHDLSIIIDFTDSIVVSKNSTIKTAYKSYLDSVFNRHTSRKSIGLNIKTKNNIFEKISPSLFIKIWKIETITNTDKSKHNSDFDTKVEFNIYGDYMKYLKELSKQDKKYTSLYKVLNSVGALGMPTTIEVLRNRDMFDFDNIHDRLWISIFLLSIEN